MSGLALKKRRHVSTSHLFTFFTVLRRLTTLDALKDVAQPLHLALGVFDGVHLGHQAVIGQALRGARADGGLAGVLTFDPHPIRVLAPDRAPRRLLASLDHKAELLEAMGLSMLVALAFDHERAAQEAEAFAAELFAIPMLRGLAVGEDWRFGKGRLGDVTMLSAMAAERGIGISCLAPVMMHGERISSTRIRQAIRDGNLTAAASMIGRPYTVEGRVVDGKKLGRTIGFPTANLEVGDEQLPPDGVWSVRARLGERRLAGVANLGLRPTVDGENRSLEVHLFDFAEDIYGRLLEIEFVVHLRGERKFASIDELKAQIARDVERAKRA